MGWDFLPEHLIDKQKSQKIKKGTPLVKSLGQANKGMGLEEATRNACQYYRTHELVMINKRPTPIQPVRVNWKRGVITKAYFKEKSTVDFTGEYKGIHVAFDTKETKVKTRFDLNLVKDHQYRYLKQNYEDGGISFLIVSFTELSETYYLPFEILQKYWVKKENGGRKSIPYSAFEDKILPTEVIIIGFLKNLRKHTNA